MIDAATKAAGRPAADVEVNDVQRRTFGDTALGCPQPGVSYAQMLTDGYRVLVKVGAKVLDFRVPAAGGAATLCQRRPSSAPSGSPASAPVDR